MHEIYCNSRLIVVVMRSSMALIVGNTKAVCASPESEKRCVASYSDSYGNERRGMSNRIVRKESGAYLKWDHQTGEDIPFMRRELMLPKIARGAKSLKSSSVLKSECEEDKSGVPASLDIARHQSDRERVVRLAR